MSRRPGPSIGRMLRWGATKACPACGQRRGLFRRWFSMVEDCPRCGLHFERLEGHWVGAVGMNTILSFGSLAITLVVGFVLTFPDFNVPLILGAGLLVAIGAPTLFFPISRTLWTAIDIAMRPLEPHEVDWTMVLPDSDPPDQPTNEPQARSGRNETGP